MGFFGLGARDPPTSGGGFGDVAGAAPERDEVCEAVAVARSGLFLPCERARDFCGSRSAGGVGAAGAARGGVGTRATAGVDGVE